MVTKVSSCQEYFDTLAARFVAGEAAGVDATFQYELEGAGGGAWHIVVKDGAFSVATGSASTPTVTYKMKADDYVKLVNGDLSGAMAFMTRKLKLTGPVGMAQKCGKLFPPLGG